MYTHIDPPHNPLGPQGKGHHEIHPTGGGHFPPFRFAVLPVASTLDSVLGRVPPARRNIHQRHAGQTKIIFS